MMCYYLNVQFQVQRVKKICVCVTSCVFSPNIMRMLYYTALKSH